MPAKRQPDEDDGSHQPKTSETVVSSRSDGPITESATDASTTTELVSNVSTSSKPACHDNAIKKQAQVTHTRKPGRSVSTDQPLSAPCRSIEDNSTHKQQHTKSKKKSSLPHVTTHASLTNGTLRSKRRQSRQSHQQESNDNQAQDDKRPFRRLSQELEIKNSFVSTNSTSRHDTRVIEQEVIHDNHNINGDLSASTNNHVIVDGDKVKHQRMSGNYHKTPPAQSDSNTKNPAPPRLSTARKVVVDGDKVKHQQQQKGNNHKMASAQTDNDLTRLIPPPIPIRRETSSQEIEPGAYQGQPGEGFRRNAPLSKHVFFATANRSGYATHQEMDLPLQKPENCNPNANLFNDLDPTNDTSNEGLARAKAVDEEDEESMLPSCIAKPAEQLEKERKRRRSLWLVSVLLFLSVLLILALLVGLIVRSQRREAKEDIVDIASSTPTTAPTDIIISGLPKATTEIILSNIDAPQTRAYQWMLNDPQLMDYSNPRKQQRFALATLFYTADNTTTTTNGRQYLTPKSAYDWLDYEVPECQWFITIDNVPSNCNAEDQYIHLFIKNYQLEGSLPPEISLLTNLITIDASDNQFRGGLPSEIGLLTSVVSLKLQNNTFKGSLPSEIGVLTGLTTLEVFDNAISGCLPSEIGSLSELKELHVQRSSISGQLPTELGYLNKLRDLWAWNTKLTGTLPTEIGRITTMNALAIFNGALSGTIPSELGLLENVEHLQIDAQNLTGSIPRELSQLKNIQFLSFEGNLLTSTIPEELGTLSNTLLAFRFYQNKLTGSIPTELGRLSLLDRLELDSNQLLQTVPTELGLLQRLALLYLANNQLSGVLPSELGLLQRLEKMTLNGNSRLGGSIPVEWEMIPNLRELYLSEADVTGVIPPGMCELDRLQVDCDANICGCDCGVCL